MTNAIFNYTNNQIQSFKITGHADFAEYGYDIVCSVLVIICTFLYAKSLQSCPTLCDPIDGSPPGSAIPGILQARILE